MADSLTGVDDTLAERARESRSWRQDYVSVMARATALSVSATASLAVADCGLRSAHDRMVVVGDSGRESSAAAWRAERDGQTRLEVEPVTVTGTGEPLRHVEVPYRGELLTGSALVAQLDEWGRRGTLEQGFVSSVVGLLDHPDRLSLPGREVVLLGAGAAMGPLAQLCRWGVSVTAVDLPTPAVWARLEELARHGAGRLVAPVGPGARAPGLHVAAELATLRPWLQHRLAELDAPVLGTYLYADGAAHVELAVAADLLAQDVAERDDSVLAYLNTPTDSYLVPVDVVGQARARRHEPSWNGTAHRAAHRLSGRRLFRPQYDTELEDGRGARWGLADALVDVQGPNYALAKRIQRWRAVVNRHAGRRTSSTVAPASWTRSVTRNRMLAAAYAGAGRFGVEIFQPETAAALMAAKLVADVHDDRDRTGAHPESLFSEDAVHGGLWRQPFEPRSALGAAALLGAPRVLRRRRAAD